MATADVGELRIKLTFDGNQVKAELADATREMEASGKKSGTKWGDAWTVAAGNLIAKGISKITNAISASMDTAIKRVDTLANSQKVFTAMGYEADAVSQSMDTLTKYLDGLPTSMTDAVQGVQILSASFGGIEKGTETFVAMNNAGLAFGATTDQISNAITQLSQLSLDGPLDAQTWNSLRNSGFSPVFAAMAKEAGVTVGQLKESFGGNGTKSVGEFLDALNKLNTEGSGDMESLAELAKANTNGIGTAMENVQNRIGKAIAKIIDHIGQENISGAINSISYAFTNVADVVIGIIEYVEKNEWIQDALLGFFGALAVVLTAAVIPAVISFTMALLANPLTWIIVGLTTVIGLIIALVRNFETVKETILAGFAAIGQVFSDLWHGMQEGLAKVGQFFTDTFQNIWNFVTGIFSGIGSFFQGVFDTIRNIFVNIAQKVGDTVSGIIKGAVNGVLKVAEDILNGPIRAINGIISVLNNIPGVSISQLTEIKLPRLAQGGVTTGPTTALIGEAGTEAVLPLDRNTGWASILASTLADEMQEYGAERNIIINVNNPTVRNDNDITLITQGISQMMRRAA